MNFHNRFSFYRAVEAIMKTERARGRESPDEPYVFQFVRGNRCQWMLFHDFPH